MKQKYMISITINISDEGERKSYSLNKEYEGDPKKLAIDVIIDGWFIENNIDKAKLDSFDASVFKKDDSVLMY